MELLRRAKQHGYTGSKTAYCALVAGLRPPKAAPIVRFEGLPGEFSQHEFGSVAGLVCKLQGITVFEKDAPTAFDRAAASRAMAAEDVLLELHLTEGAGSGVVLTSDLGYRYVEVNAEYTTLAVRSVACAEHGPRVNSLPTCWSSATSRPLVMAPHAAVTKAPADRCTLQG